MYPNNPIKMEPVGLKDRILCLVLAMVWFYFFPASVSAHKVTIFAWVDGDIIHTQSKFSGGKRVKNAPVLVYDSKDVLLLEGKTDENGMFTFNIPKKAPLKIVLKAAMGHMAVWKLPPEELGEPESQSAVTSKGRQPILQTTPRSGEIQKENNRSEFFMVSLKRGEIEDIIDASLDKKLRPITEMLADAMDREPGITEIIGGIGYIFGLVGVALYFTNRKRNH